MPRKLLGRDCDDKAEQLVECLLEHIDVEHLEQSLRRAVAICGCNKKLRKIKEEERMAELQSDPEAIKTLQAMAELGKSMGTYYENPEGDGKWDLKK
jgi:hypothetical protein